MIKAKFINKNGDFLKKSIVNKTSYTLEKNQSINPKVRWIHTPLSINELVTTENFSFYLSSSIILFHNKSPSCNNLISEKLRKITIHLEKIEILITSKNIEKTIRRIKTNQKPRKIFCIECSNSKLFNRLSQKISQSKETIQNAVWLKGYIEDSMPYIPRMFDGIFIFDTSEKDYDLLKQKISISDNAIHQLREGQSEVFANENVIFYWNYENRHDAPILSSNPIILGLERHLNKRASSNSTKIQIISGEINLNSYTNYGQTVTFGDKNKNYGTVHQSQSSPNNNTSLSENDIESIKELISNWKKNLPKDVDEGISFQALSTLSDIITPKRDQHEMDEAISKWNNWYFNLPEKTMQALTVAASVATLTPPVLKLFGAG